MEFKLNKIDTDIRKKMQEKIKDDKVHSAKSISIKRDIKDNNDKSNMEYETEDEKEIKYITIDSIKYKHEELEIEVEKSENIDQETFKGRIIDTKK